MLDYTQTYFSFFGYDISDFVPCEVSGHKAVDVAHIYPKGKYPELRNDIFNMAAATRAVHIEYENKKDELLKIHLRFMLKNQPKKTIEALKELDDTHTLFNQIKEVLDEILPEVEIELNEIYRQ